MVAFNIGKTLKGEFEDGREAMDGTAACKRVNLAEEDRGYISVLFIWGKWKENVLEAKSVRGTTRPWLIAEETQAWWHAPMLRIDPATVRHYLSLMNWAIQVGG
jgi:hypothetical protein